MARSKAFSFTKFVRQLLDHFNNWKSEILMLVYQWRRGEEVEFFTDLKEKMQIYLQSGYHVLEHFVLLPSSFDRFQLLNELWRKHSLIIAPILVLAAVA